MSFSKYVKNEILEKKIGDKNCKLAFLSGLVGAIGKLDNNMCLRLGSDIENLGTAIDELVFELYSEHIEIIKIENFGINKVDYYNFVFSKNLTKKLLPDIDCLDTNQQSIALKNIVSEKMTNNEQKMKAYVAGVFIGTGTSSIKFSDEQRKTTGYHLEFASKNHDFLAGIATLIAQFDIFAKLIKRKNMYVLYVKDASEVSNVLALIGAYDSVLQLQNEMATREVRNKVNRQTNCMSANINKTVEASMKQVSAIEKIISKIGLENLPDDLQTVALLRLANTEESLDELLKLSRLPFTKSALNHRFKKLLKIAESLD